MKPRILLVDDEINLVEALVRQMRRTYDIRTALSGAEALETIARNGPFAVIVSDLRMPGMDGIRLLARVKTLAPDCVRIMLTGYADVQTAVESVNEGNLFRFLTKPSSADAMRKAIEAGVAQHRLIVAERELLELTLKGAIKAISDVLALVNPTAFGRAARIHRLTRRIALRLKIDDLWETETAAMLSQVGCVAVPEGVLRKLARGEELEPEEARTFRAHPALGRDLTASIPRMERVAEIIGRQEDRYEAGAGDIPLGARILKVVLDFDQLEDRSLSPRDALAQLRRDPGAYDCRVLHTLEDVITLQEAGPKYLLREVGVDELKSGMIFAQDVWSEQGLLLVSRGQETAVPLTLRLRNFARNAAVRQPFKVLLPLPGAEASGC